jgi:broad specificity phosphatase PhoE
MSRPTLYYVRHGETDWNVEQRLQGRRDIAINARGRVQARHCGHILGGLFQRDNLAARDLAFVSSPLQRARETMELMRAALGLASDGYEIDERLAEISFGAWEGLTLAEVHERDAAALAARERDKWAFTPPDGESYADVTARIGAWYAGITRDTVVVAHGGTARAIIAHLGIMPPHEAPLCNIENGVVYVFTGATMARYT